MIKKVHKGTARREKMVGLFSSWFRLYMVLLAKSRFCEFLMKGFFTVAAAVGFTFRQVDGRTTCKSTATAFSIEKLI